MTTTPHDAFVDLTSLTPDAPFPPSGTQDWRRLLPTLTGPSLTLRELELADAPALQALLSNEQVARFISPSPDSVAAFEKFIDWMQLNRGLGTYACFAVVPHGQEQPIGLFQIRALSPDFATAEWGFVLAASHWGRGTFLEGASLMLTFAFDTLGVHRLEARAAVANGRGNGALRKVGAVREAVLRRAFARDGESVDQALWSLLANDWREQRAAVPSAPVH
ncbi:MAG: GNAT family N-acetyltransferase [Acidobacteriota bacterium]